MIEKCAVKVTTWLIKNEVKSETERELYQYAVYSILLTVSPIFLAIVIGYLFGCVWRSILIILPFVTIRKFSGGYHTKRARTCLVGSSLLLMLCIVISFYIQWDWIWMGITVAATTSLSYFSPLDNDNRPLSSEEQICYKTHTMLISLFFLSVVSIFFLFRLYTCATCISIGMIMSACLQFPVLFQKDKKNQKQQKKVV